MIHLKNVNFEYDSIEKVKAGLKDVNLSISSGECVVICGRSGCGKSTLLRIINGLIPHFYEGNLSGQVYVKNQNMRASDLHNVSKLVGSVFQNPSTQFFNVDTTSELAFGCENIGYPRAKIHQRIQEVTDLFGLETLIDRNIFDLSGGEKQRIACASIHASSPEIYVMDEPTANLDKSSIDRLREIIKVLKDSGKTVVISEHQLYYLKGLADRYVYMKDGKVERSYKASVFERLETETMNMMGLRSAKLPKFENALRLFNMSGMSQLTVDDLKFKRGRKTIVDIPKLSIDRGDILAITGENGAGKSTLIQCLSGMLKHKGTIRFKEELVKSKRMKDKCFVVMQDVNSQLFAESVFEEVGLNVPEEKRSEIDEILKMLSLEKLRDKHPMALSGGEKQRVAIASSLVAGKEILIFDEPTSGLDRRSMEQMSLLIKNIIDKLFCVIIVTHDDQLIDHCCNRVMNLKHGGIHESFHITRNEHLESKLLSRTAE